MKLGFHFADFTHGAEPSGLAAQIDDFVSWVDEAGFDRLSVMDHYFQIPQLGPAEHEMFEAYGLLGYIAARTSRVRLGVLTSGVTYRNPGFLVKQVTGLDVLSRGRAWFGIGAAWFEREHAGLGTPFPPLSERFERVEETLRIAQQMWSDDNGPFAGEHYQLAETICSPRPVQQPRPPILIAGSGEKKTLRLVARYGDACNVRGESPEAVARLYGILRDHCEAEGRDYNSIERTISTRFDPGPDGERVDAEVERLGRLAEAGVQVAMGYVIGCGDPRVREAMARLIPQVAAL